MISWMAGDFFAESPALAYAIAALAIQMTVFCGISLRTLLTSKSTIESRARMPLRDEESGHE